MKNSKKVKVELTKFEYISFTGIAVLLITVLAGFIAR